MTWEIVTGIIAMCGCIMGIGAVIARNTRTMAMLETTIQTLQKTLDKFEADNRESHKEFRINIKDHEKRIVVLEEKRKGDMK